MTHLGSHVRCLLLLHPFKWFSFSLRHFFSPSLSWPQAQSIEVNLLRLRYLPLTAFVQQPPFIFFPLSPPLYATLVLLFWGLFLTGEASCGQHSQHPPAWQGCDPALPPEEQAGTARPGEQTAHHLAWQCQSWLRLELPHSDRVCPQLFSFPACSCLCFVTTIQPVHLRHLSIASSHLWTHFTATGKAPPEKKKHFTSPRFHQNTLPRPGQHRSSLLATTLSGTTTMAADLPFAAAMEDAIWSLQSKTCLRHKQSLQCAA